MGSEKPMVFIDEAPNHPPLTNLPEPQVEGGTVIEVRTPLVAGSQFWAEATMKTCKTCRHWTPVDDAVVNPTETDESEPWTVRSLPVAFEVRRCKSPLLKQDVRPAESHHASTAGDGSGVYAAPLYTGPDFGCVNHEAGEDIGKVIGC